MEASRQQPGGQPQQSGACLGTVLCFLPFSSMSDQKPRTTPYHVLGLEPNASKEQVKEAFRKLCMQYHPDKQRGGRASDIIAAETKFRLIKDAYEILLKSHAGYSPPPPGSKASRYPQGSSQASAHEGGPVRTGGPYGGYRTEYEFYTSGFRTSRNNPLLLIAMGLIAIPVISTLTGLLTGEATWIQKFRDEGIHGWSESRFKVK